MQTYGWWDEVPEHLMTRTALGKEGLKPAGPIAAKIEYGKGRRHRIHDLYNRNEATPKQKPTPAQLAALEKARIATRTCSKCGTVVEKPSLLGKRTGRCINCRMMVAEGKRTHEVDKLIAWARSMLANPDALILDTETTALMGYICEIGIIRMDGTVVYESLVNPQEPNYATDIHGISDRMTWSAPTFADIEPDLRWLLHGRTVVVFNAAYDSEVLEIEIRRLCTPSDEALAWLVKTDWDVWDERGYGLLAPGWKGQVRRLKTIRDDSLAYRRVVTEHSMWWCERIGWECAMLKYSCFVGEWSERYHDYKYQALGGGHRAVGDCQATLAVLKRMANTPLSTERMHEVPECSTSDKLPTIG